MKKTVCLCALWAMFVAPTAYGASCMSDADCESTSSSGGIGIGLACPTITVGLKTYVGIEKHSFTHDCVFKSGVLLGTCAQRTSPDVRYACCVGYYGTCSDNTDITTCNCTRCPAFSDASGTVYGTTAGPVAGNSSSYSGNAPSKTDCYIPAEKSYEDADGTGTFEFTSKCNYTN